MSRRAVREQIRESALKKIQAISKLPLYELSKEEEIELFEAICKLPPENSYLWAYFNGAPAHFKRLVQLDVCEPMGIRVGELRRELEDLKQAIEDNRRRLKDLHDEVHALERRQSYARGQLERVRQEASNTLRAIAQ